MKDFEFNGKGGDYFLLMLKNFFLSLITLGLYSFKARVNRRKYFWSHTSWRGQPFAFSGTVKDQLQGLAWLFGILILMGVLGIVASLALSTVLPPPFSSIGAIPFVFVALMALVCRMKFGGYRYRARNTVYRGLRGNLDREAFKPYFYQTILGSFFIVMTLGIYRPFQEVKLAKLRWENTYWGNQKFGFDGVGSELFWMDFKGMCLALITLGFYMPWYMAKRVRYKINHITFMNGRFDLDITGGLIIKEFLYFSFINLITLGFATPWLITGLMKTLCNHVSHSAQIDFDSVITDAKAKKAAAGDGAGDLMDFDGGFDLVG